MATCKDYIHYKICRIVYRNGDDRVLENSPCASYQNKADFVEVKHGEWITDENGVVICSECGEEHEWQDFRPPYCDMCGSKNRDGRRDA